jgi:hypothetical protein
MSESNAPGEEAESLFFRSDSAGTKAVWWLVGGIVGLGFAVLGMVVAIVARVDPLSVQVIATLPAIVGVGALTVAASLFRSPLQVAVGPRGLSIEGRRGKQTHSWDQIGWANVDTVTMTHRRQLVVYDTRGKTIARLSEAFDDFDAMADQIRDRIAAKGDDTSDRIRGRKAVRSAVLCTSVGLLMLAAMGFLAWHTHQEQRAAVRLEQDAVPGEAEIVRRFLAPNGVTPRIEYRITTPDGRTATRNAEAFRPDWDKLEGARTVAVLYVPDDPDISRLAAGEPRERDLTSRPAVAYGASVLAGLVALFLVVVGVMQWYGWDIDLDSKTGKISIKRFGSGR